MNVSWGIMHRPDVGIFDPSKNKGAFTEKRTKGLDSSFSHISPKYRFGQILTWVKVFRMMRSICGQIFVLICLAMFELLPVFDVFFVAVFSVISFKNLLL